MAFLLKRNATYLNRLHSNVTFNLFGFVRFSQDKPDDMRWETSSWDRFDLVKQESITMRFHFKSSN